MPSLGNNRIYTKALAQDPNFNLKTKENKKDGRGASEDETSDTFRWHQNEK